MTKDNGREKIAVVTGDLTVDWNLALSPGTDGGSDNTLWHDTDARCYQQRGGAGLLADLITCVADNLRGGRASWRVRSSDLPLDLASPCDERFHHSHAIWVRSEGEDPAWRVKEFLGLSRQLPVHPEQRQVLRDDPPDADLIVLDDADLGFREHPELWPGSIAHGDGPVWILVKMARPVAQGALWDHLRGECAERAIVVVTINDLRLSEVQISRELSWERTAHDLYWELTHNPLVNALSRCAHVVVSFDTAGAFLLSRSGHQSQTGSGSEQSFDCTLFFDPTIVEGMWSQAYPGGMIGYTSCLTAGIARQLMRNPSSPDVPQGIQSGLAAMRLLHQKGYTEPCGVGEHEGLQFPRDPVAERLACDGKLFKTANVPSPVRFLSTPKPRAAKKRQEGGWSIIQDRYSESLEQVAREIVLQGVEEGLDGVPLGKFGKLITADRREVESLRSIRSLIGEYCGQSLTKPLSIAVFGPPGSGKSFAVKQIAASLRPGELELVPLEFNLSQTGSVDELHDSFHQVRDVALSGKMPLVFWDEFDSTYENRPLGWLRYFLAPMQDGAFQEGQILHPIGRCVFVFAGGTCSRMEDFDTLLSEREFIQMKGPDFVSRLKGYVNILGPNPHTMEEGATDPYYLIRRAIILRVLLQMNAPQFFRRADGAMRLNIDRGVLRALLHVREYKHGVRSLESIISTSSLVGKTSFDRSSLPPETQLNLHVDGREFLALAQQLELEGEVLEELAEAAHGAWWESRKREGWKLGPRNDARKTSPLLKPYSELDEIYKDSNRVMVRNIPTKIAAAGYIMVPARSEEPPLNFPGDALERLAELEHELWVESKFEQGFTLGRPTPENPRRHEHLVDWAEVPDEVKEIDRDLVRAFPLILARAGYAVVKLASEPQS